jgi:hypothetical protein
MRKELARGINALVDQRTGQTADGGPPVRPAAIP